MKPVPVGTRIRVTRCVHNHSYRIGGIYTVFEDDHDGTFKAADAKGRVGNWLRWEECEPAGPSVWDRIAADLPDDLVTFLSCFDGIAEIELKDTVVDAVLRSVPDLPERLIAVARSQMGEHFVAANRPQARQEQPTP
ncbi:MAG: hypothetical protein ACKO6B_00920 [Planctomycetia bacterium]